ncbi:MAG: large conductance mechanosensitive channel protein MscL [Gammaproteobacteria bacterium]|nr:large conductance mechanosensitive channel protein MscL [Gammaproteobacteria bacterium]
MLDEFKKFIMRGNVVDLAVGIIIGGAFGKIVSSLVSDVMMPPLGMLMGNVDFSSLFISLSSKHYPTLAAAKLAGAPTINYGLFINSVIDFIIVSAAVFGVVKVLSKLHKQEAAAPPQPSREELLLTDIRDLLKSGR